MRHLSDAEINKTKVKVIRDGELQEINWSQIIVCIIILIKKKKALSNIFNSVVILFK